MPRNKKATVQPSVEPQLVGRVEAARLCDLSLRVWNELSAAGETPRPILRSGQFLWRTNDLRRWITHTHRARRLIHTGDNQR